MSQRKKSDENIGEKTQPRREVFFTHGCKRQIELVSQVWIGRKKKSYTWLNCSDHRQVSMLEVQIMLYKLTLYFAWPYWTAVQKNRSFYWIRNPHQFKDSENSFLVTGEWSNCLLEGIEKHRVWAQKKCSFSPFLIWTNALYKQSTQNTVEHNTLSQDK